MRVRRARRHSRSRSSAGSPILSAVHVEPPAARRERARARGRPQPLEPTHRYIATLATLGYLEQDRGDAAVPAGPARARPRLLGDQLDGAAPDRRARPPGALRRDRPHGQHGRPRRRSTSSTSSAAAAPARASARSTSTSTSARACRPTAPRWARCCSPRLPDEELEARLARIDFARRGPNTITARQRARRGARAGARAAASRQQRGARLRPALDRRAGARPRRRRGRRDQPRRAPLARLDGGPRRAARPGAPARPRPTSRRASATACTSRPLYTTRGAAHLPTLPRRPCRQPAPAEAPAAGARRPCRREDRRGRAARDRGRGDPRGRADAGGGGAAVGDRRRVPPGVVAHGLHLPARRHLEGSRPHLRQVPQRRGRHRVHARGAARQRRARRVEDDLRRRLHASCGTP